MQILHCSICKLNYWKAILAVQDISPLYISAVSYSASIDVNQIGV